MDELTRSKPEAADELLNLSTNVAQTTWRPFSPRGPTPLAPPQFGLRAMMLGMAIIAVFLGLSRLIHIWALVLAFMGYVAARIVDYGRGEPVNSRKRWIYDLVIGVLVPIGCLFYDPGIFTHHAARVTAWGVFGSQMAMFTVWLFAASRLSTKACGFFAGYLRFGAIAALLVALLMTPITIIGLFMVLGVLGFVPYLTAVTYSRHAQNAWFHAGAGRERATAVSTGFLTAAAVGIVAWSLRDFIPREWLEQTRPWSPFLWFD